MHFASIFPVCLSTASAIYVIQDTYESSTFASRFDFFTADDPTNGFVNYVDRTTAQDAGMYRVDGSQVYMGVDYTNVSLGRGRNSIRIESKQRYFHGLFLLDLAHMPGGQCGAWPAFWLLGADWPKGGEIDVIEGVNSQTANVMTLHTNASCSITDRGQFTGSLNYANCDTYAPDQPTSSGCSLTSPTSSSYGSGFNAGGGGIYALEWTSEAITIWFFPRYATPPDVASGAPDPDSWGLPMGQFSGGCDIDAHFTPQQIIFDVTFCGAWAGEVWATDRICSSQAASCQDYVQNNPSAFEETYWLINSLQIFQQAGAASSTYAITTPTTVVVVPSQLSSSETTTSEIHGYSTIAISSGILTSVETTSPTLASSSIPVTVSDDTGIPTSSAAIATFTTSNSRRTSISFGYTKSAVDPIPSRNASAATATLLLTDVSQIWMSTPYPGAETPAVSASIGLPSAGAVSTSVLPSLSGDDTAVHTMFPGSSISSPGSNLVSVPTVFSSRQLSTEATEAYHPSQLVHSTKSSDETRLSESPYIPSTPTDPFIELSTGNALLTSTSVSSPPSFIATASVTIRIITITFTLSSWTTLTVTSVIYFTSLQPSATMPKNHTSLVSSVYISTSPTVTAASTVVGALLTSGVSGNDSNSSSGENTIQQSSTLSDPESNASLASSAFHSNPDTIIFSNPSFDHFTEDTVFTTTNMDTTNIASTINMTSKSLISSSTPSTTAAPTSATISNLVSKPNFSSSAKFTTVIKRITTVTTITRTVVRCGPITTSSTAATVATAAAAAAEVTGIITHHPVHQPHPQWWHRHHSRKVQRKDTHSRD